MSEVNYVNIKIDQFGRMPLDIQKTIMYKLSFTEIMNICQTNKMVMKICKDDEFWNIYFNKNSGQFVDILDFVLKYTNKFRILGLMKNHGIFKTDPVKVYLNNKIDIFETLPVLIQNFLLQLDSNFWIVYFNAVSRERFFSILILLMEKTNNILNIFVLDIMKNHCKFETDYLIQYHLSSLLIDIDKFNAIPLTSQIFLTQLHRDKVYDKNAVMQCLLNLLPQIKNEEVQKLIIQLDSDEFTDKKGALQQLLFQIPQIKSEEVQKLIIELDSDEFEDKSLGIHILNKFYLQNKKYKGIRKLIESIESGPLRVTKKSRMVED